SVFATARRGAGRVATSPGLRPDVIAAKTVRPRIVATESSGIAPSHVIATPCLIATPYVIAASHVLAPSIPATIPLRPAIVIASPHGKVGARWWVKIAAGKTPRTRVVVAKTVVGASSIERTGTARTHAAEACSATTPIVSAAKVGPMTAAASKRTAADATSL